MIGFTLTVNADNYKRLCEYAAALQKGEYIAISDTDIDKGVEYEKSRQKLIKKLFEQIAPKMDMTGIDEAIDAYCEAWRKRFKEYKKQHGQL